MRTTVMAAVVVAALGGSVVSACSSPSGSAGTLPRLPTTPSTAAPTTAPAPPHAAWFARHGAAVREHLDALWDVHDGLAAAPDHGTRLLVCTAAQTIEQPAHERALRAPGAHPDWAHAVVVARFLVGACAAGDTDGVPADLAELEAALGDVEAWLAESLLLCPYPGAS